MLDVQGEIVTSDKLVEKKSKQDLTQIPAAPEQSIPPDVYIRGLIQQELLNLGAIRLGVSPKTMRLDSSGLWFGADTAAAAILKILLNGKLKIQRYDYSGGTTGGPESDTDLENGMIYIAENFGVAGTHKLRARIAGAWKEATLS